MKCAMYDNVLITKKMPIVSKKNEIVIQKYAWKFDIMLYCI